MKLDLCIVDVLPIVSVDPWLPVERVDVHASR